MEERRDKINYYLDIAEAVLGRGTCIRRNYGAVIVRNDEIVSTGYTGSPRQKANCSDLGNCMRKKLNVKSGSNYELCKSVHAEQNCIISARRSDMIGSVLYLCGKEFSNKEYVRGAQPCIICKKMIINTGIEKVIVRETKDKYAIIEVKSWLVEDF